MQECLTLYRSSTNDELRDAHHGSIVVDCCARCGDANEAENIINEMLLVSQSKQSSSSGQKKPQRTGNEQPHYFWEEYDRFSYKHVPIQAWTALLKGYVHSGMMEKADSLFQYLCRNVHNTNAPGGTKRKRDGIENGPNVRTVNTLLRGCLWTATSLRTTTDANRANMSYHRPYELISTDILVGGVVTAKRAWSLCEDVNIRIDSSSYEYFITLLSQALRLEDAEKCLQRMRGEFSISDCDKVGDDDACDPTMIESLVVCLVAIARGYVLLGDEKNGQRCAEEALRYIHALDSTSTNTSCTTAYASNNDTPTKRRATGGKKAWKENNTTTTNLTDEIKSTGRRDESNKLYRSHRLSELRTEASLLLNLCSMPHIIVTKSPSYVAKAMLTRLLIFSGGGTTGKDATVATTSTGVNVEETTQQWINSLWTSFGLKETVLRLLKGFFRERDLDSSLMDMFVKLIPKKRKQVRKLPSNLPADICKRLRANIAGKHSSISSDSGRINFENVFKSLNDYGSASSSSSRQRNTNIHIELGAGAGDWACLQAKLNPLDYYVTVELRADRVAQTFAKTLLRIKSLTNICCVGSECGSFLRDRVEEGTINTIFVNHPEPPTQTYNDTNVNNAEEPAHMLNYQTIMSAYRCLKPLGVGRLIIVTDNLIYARYLCRNLTRMISEGDLDLVGACQGEVRELTQVESFGHHSSLILYEGKPSQSIGHYTPKSVEGGTSYFDRLWRTGAGKHAEMMKRYIICLKTRGGDQEASSNERASAEEDVTRQTEEGKGPGKKRCADKQRRRNERRLLKKHQLGNR
jgi:pentatricopeptide repeat protein